MRKTRRDFIRLAGLAGLSLADPLKLKAVAYHKDSKSGPNREILDYVSVMLQDGSTLATPFWRIESGRNGPAMAFIAAQHGNEVQGVEVARRLKEVCLNKLVKGSLWLIPMSNILAIRSRRHSYDLAPEQNNRLNPDKLNNMNGVWPGDPGGNNTDRVAYALDQAVLRHCSHAMDMHCWEHIKAPETLTLNDHELSSMLGDITTTKFISHSASRQPADKMNVRQLFRVRGEGSVTIELSGQFQMQEKQVQIGLSSMLNIMKLLGMMDGKPEPVKGPRVEHNPKTSHKVPSPCTGIFMPGNRNDKKTTLIPEDYVEKGQSLGHIIRESDLATVPVIAPVSGYLWQYGVCHWDLCDASLPAQHPYTEEGETVAIIVTK